MITPLDVLLFLLLIVAAVLALRVRDLLAAAALLAGYSLFVALLFAGVSALDVALVEAALGAGLTGVLLIATVLATTRRSVASEGPRQRGFVLVLVAGFVGLMLFASGGLPDRGDPEAPQHTGVATEYLSRSMEDTETPNVVTALLADYRSLDTLGETLVILTAALAAALVLVRRDDDPDDADGSVEDGTDDVEGGVPLPGDEEVGS